MIPDSPFAISADWLNDALPAGVLGEGTVTHVATDDIGAGVGIFGEIARLNLTLDGGAAPTSIVAKMACTEPANLAVAQALGLYDREINMFAHVLDQTPLRSPACLLARRGGDGQFILLLEDLSSDYDVGDQVVGATVAQAEAIVDELAALHAYWWQKPQLAAMDWLPVPDAPTYRAAVPGIYRAGLPVLETEWADKVPAASIELARRLEPTFEDLLIRTAGGPETLIHTDTRLDNIFFAKDGSGGVAFIDFQLALRGRGVADIAYLLGTSVPHAEGREHWERLLRRWHARLVELGVNDYPIDDAIQHYKEAALYYLSGAMSLIGTFDAGNERGAAMADAYSTRILNHVVDINAGTVL